MPTPLPAPDPTAATDVPRERARLPPAPTQVGGREWFRRGERQGQPDEFDLLSAEELPEERLLRQAEATVEDETTDPGAPPVSVEERPYTNLDYEERVCRLLEDIRENTRRLDLRLAAEEHRRNVTEADALELQPQSKSLRGTMQRCVEHWFLDVRFKDLVVKVLVIGTTAGGSVAGGVSTMVLVMELVERLLRAWVQLP